MGSEPLPTSSEEQLVLRQRAAAARETARGLLVRCIELAERYSEIHPWSQQTVDANAELRRQLQTCVHEYGATLRAGAVAPEAMIIELKSMIRDSMDAAPQEATLRLADDVVRWSIEGYYAA